VARSLRTMLARVGEEKARARAGRTGPPADGDLLGRVQESLDGPRTGSRSASRRTHSSDFRPASTRKTVSKRKREPLSFAATVPRVAEMLSRKGYEHALIGGLAVGVWVEPRANPLTPCPGDLQPWALPHPISPH
jgi:hypothetical protein